MNHITTAFTLGSITIILIVFLFVFLSPNPPDFMFDDLQTQTQTQGQYTQGQTTTTGTAIGAGVTPNGDDSELEPLRQNQNQNQNENQVDGGLTPFETATRGNGWSNSEVSDREAADQRIMASIGDMSREEIEMNKLGYHWLIVTQFAGWITVSCVVIFWTSFTGIDVYNGDPTASYGSAKLKDFENGVNFGVFGLLLKAVVSVNTSLGYPLFTKCFSNRSLFIIGEFIMGIVCILVYIIDNEVALLILISIFGFAMQLHMQTCPEFTDGEFRPLYDNIMKNDGSWIKYFLENSLVIAPVIVALFGGPIADAINDEFRWIFLIPGLIMIVMNWILLLAFLNLMPGVKLPPPKSTHDADLYEQETYLP